MIPTPHLREETMSGVKVIPTRDPKTDVAPASPAAKRRDEGRARRQQCARSSHAQLGSLADGRDVVAMIKASNEDRLENLIPVRYSRMLESPFAFFRGTANLQAADLAHSPASGIPVQACGDAHLVNFGGFATPERNLVFDVNDFDETFPAPWEWDVKRLCASLALAARWRGFSTAQAREAANAGAARYREMMDAYAEMSTLEVWYSRVSFDYIRQQVQTNRKLARIVDTDVKRAQSSTSEHVYGKITTGAGGAIRIVDEPLLCFTPMTISMPPDESSWDAMPAPCGRIFRRCCHAFGRSTAR